MRGRARRRAADEIAHALVDAGFLQGTSRPHPGQGTENRRFFFDGFMFELLFLTSRKQAAAERTRPLALSARFDDPAGSPFGIASRPSEPARRAADYPHVLYRPAYLPDALAIAIAERLGVALGEAERPCMTLRLGGAARGERLLPHPRLPLAIEL